MVPHYEANLSMLCTEMPLLGSLPASGGEAGAKNAALAVGDGGLDHSGLPRVQRVSGQRDN